MSTVPVSVSFASQLLYVNLRYSKLPTTKEPVTSIRGNSKLRGKRTGIELLGLLTNVLINIYGVTA